MSTACLQRGKGVSVSSTAGRQLDGEPTTEGGRRITHPVRFRGPSPNKDTLDTLASSASRDVLTRNSFFVNSKLKFLAEKAKIRC